MTALENDQKRNFIEKLKDRRWMKIVNEPFYFVRFYFILLFFQSLFMMAPKMQVHINQIFILWGSLIVVYFIFLEQDRIQTKTTLFLGTSLILGLITILFNREAGSLGYSLKTWYLLVLVFGIFFPFFGLTKKSRDEVLRGIGIPLIILQFSGAVISLILFFNNIAGYIIRPDSNFFWGLRYNFRQSGAINPLLIGIYNDPNYAAIIIFSSVIFSLLILEQKKNSLVLKIFLWLNIMLESYFLILTNTRSAYLSLALVLAVIFILYIKDKAYKKVKVKWLSKNILVFIIVSLIVLFMGDFIRDLSYKHATAKEVTRVTVFLPHSVIKEELPKSEMEEDELNILVVKAYLSDSLLGERKYFLAETQDQIIEDSEVFKRISAEKEDTVSGLEGKGNGRIGRWMETFSIVSKHKPLTGTSPRGAEYFAEKYATEQQSYWRLRAGYSPVNSYLTYLLYYGFPVFLLLAYVYLRGGVKIMLRLFRTTKMIPQQVLMGSLLLFMLIEAVFLSALVEVCTYYSCILAFAFSYHLSEFEGKNRLVIEEHP